jgi:hypothetical protein
MATLHGLSPAGVVRLAGPALDAAGGVAHAGIIGTSAAGTAALPAGPQGSALPCDVITHVVESSQIGQTVQNLRARCARL